MPTPASLCLLVALCRMLSPFLSLKAWQLSAPVWPLPMTALPDNHWACQTAAPPLLPSWTYNHGEWGCPMPSTRLRVRNSHAPTKEWKCIWKNMWHTSSSEKSLWKNFIFESHPHDNWVFPGAAWALSQPANLGEERMSQTGILSVPQPMSKAVSAFTLNNNASFSSPSFPQDVGLHGLRYLRFQST